VGPYGLPDTPIGLGGKMDDTSVVVGEASGVVAGRTLSPRGWNDTKHGKDWDFHGKTMGKL